VNDEQPSHVTFYFDTTHGKLISELLRKVEVDVKNYRNLCLPADADDKDWIERCGSHGWVIISGDKNISRVPEERQAVIEGRCKVFMFDDSDVTRTEDWAASLLVARQHIMEMALRTNGPCFVLIKPCRVHGHVRSPEFIGIGGWKPQEEWPKAIRPTIEHAKPVKVRRESQSTIDFPEHVAIQIYRSAPYHCELCAQLFDSLCGNTKS
jgi:hypothetical protein